ncbi:MAG: hypothetical protein QM235_12015 [Pseudomonadota bacterium]|nr:hypothetical protein [Pseudomonadota bacterium]
MSGIKRQERIKANKERRRLRREQVAQEKEDQRLQRIKEHEEWLRERGPNVIFEGKSRRGDACTVRFVFSGIPVPVNLDEVGKEGFDSSALVAETQIVLAQAKQDKGDPSKVN